MSLRERVERTQRNAGAGAEAGAPAGAEVAVAKIPEPPVAPKGGGRLPPRDELLADIRRRLQQEVIDSFESLIEAADQPAEVRNRIVSVVDRIIIEQNFSVTRDERLNIVEEVVQEITGYGPIEPYLNDETVTEVMVNGPKSIYIERAGKLIHVDAVFLNDDHVKRIIDRIIAPLGRHIDDTSPRVDARLPDGSRVNAIIEPLSLIGPIITVRKFSKKPFTVSDLIDKGTASPEMFDFLRACVEARLNIFVSGGTGSGKTTLLNVISSFIPEEDRIVTIEDAAELQLRQEHVVTLEARPPNIEGAGEITIRDLLRNAMHMRPDRVIVGECRSGEALDMIQAMTSGHDGSLSTGHANTTQDMLRRIETMILMTGYELPLRAIREQIASAVDLIVHTARLRDGSRKIVNITEVYGIEDDEILTEDIFVFEQTAFTDGKVVGELRPTGERPGFMGAFKANGVELPPGEFGIPPEDPSKPMRPRKSRWIGGVTGDAAGTFRSSVGIGKAVKAGGMVYVSAIGPLNPDTGQMVNGSIKEHTRQCVANQKAKLEAEGSSLEKIVWANWSLREPSELETFSEEWLKWFPGDAPLGQGTLMPLSHRRAGFRVSLGAIAEA
ncbi:MAG: pilus assembly protein CpaF [Chloroflexota bacterium]|nr:pilus assembly protein CpaF [Chloroflexota bacterium]